ncbi:MAG: trigger factor [Verrucomicrobiae bacterium]|nr:trigger factor [Verrucomicrobiae bacterium]
MNVTIEQLAPCRKLLRIEVDAQTVDATFESVTKEFQRLAVLPGFRPGKAPRELILRRFEKEIEEEVKEKLINESYRKALEERKIDTIGAPDIEEIQFGRGQPFVYAATVETAPEFELPEYKGLLVRREIAFVTDDDVERALQLLREKQATFNPVNRPAQPGDVLVINYAGSCDGAPIAQLAPDAKSLGERKNFWIGTGPGDFLPGFAEQLLGAQPGEKRTVSIDFPPDFFVKELAGRHAVYDVELVEVREKVLPPLDDAFAKSWGAESLEKLKQGVRRDLENELKYKENRSIRNQLIRALLERCQFELPESPVAAETRNVVYDIVRENAQRGVPRELIEQQKDQIYAAAARSAKERVKLAFIIQKIAEKEGIKVSEEELLRRVQALAALYQIPVEKFLKDLRKRGGLIEIYDQIAAEKVLDFLQANARYEDVPAEKRQT